MSEKPKLKYEKPVSIDMGRVAPVLGDSCSFGEGAEPCVNGGDAVNDCSAGYGNAMIRICQIGDKDSNLCDTGLSAGGYGCSAGEGVVA